MQLLVTRAPPMSNMGPPDPDPAFERDAAEVLSFHDPPGGIRTASQWDGGGLEPGGGPSELGETRDSGRRLHSAHRDALAKLLRLWGSRREGLW